MWQRLERKISFLCLFVYLLFFFFFAIRISRFFPLTFFAIRIFFHPHFSTHIRHPQISGPYFTDTPSKDPKLQAVVQFQEGKEVESWISMLRCYEMCYGHEWGWTLSGNRWSQTFIWNNRREKLHYLRPHTSKMLLAKRILEDIRQKWRS